MFIEIIYCPVSDVINFKINPQLSYQAFFLYGQKNQDKNINAFKTKRAFSMK